MPEALSLQSLPTPSGGPPQGQVARSSPQPALALSCIPVLAEGTTHLPQQVISGVETEMLFWTAVFLNLGPTDISGRIIFHRGAYPNASQQHAHLYPLDARSPPPPPQL